MIKAYSVAYDKEAIRKLDMKNREEQIIEHLHDLIPEQRFMKAELPVFDEQSQEGDFVPGLAAENISEFIPEEESKAEMTEQEIESMREQIRDELTKQMQQNADALIAKARERANQEASEIIEKAKQEAELAKASILKIASGQGYEEGLARAKQEEKAVTDQLQDEIRKTQQEYERRVSELEPAFVKIVKELVIKLTNVSYENHNEVISYLIEQGLNSSEKDTEFTVLLHPEDMLRIEDSVPALQDKYKDKITLNFKKDETLSQGDCILENATKRIDCGLGTQMQGLLDSLAILSE